MGLTSYCITDQWNEANDDQNDKYPGDKTIKIKP